MGIISAPVLDPANRTFEASLYAIVAPESTASPFAGSIRIVNRSPATTRLGISVEGYLFSDKDEMLAYIAAIPPMYDGEPDYRKAWRFLTARAYFYTPFTGSDQQHDPLLFVNSLGYGYCDDFATVLAKIWQWQGYESRVWWLNGHVVPEIEVNDRWMMFDGDFGLYYTDRAGDVASVTELAADPQLILQPIDPLYDLSYLGYQPLISNIYGSMANNHSELPVTGESRGMQVDLPAGSEFVFPIEAAADTSLFEDATLSHPLYYGAQLNIPVVARDTLLQLPLFAVGISGIGKVEIGGQVFDIGSTELDGRFGPFWIADSYTEPVTTLTLRAGACNVAVRMSLSAFVVNGSTNARVHIFQRNDSASVHVTYTASANRAQAPVSEILTGVDRHLDQIPYGYISPLLVASELGRSLSK